MLGEPGVRVAVLRVVGRDYQPARNLWGLLRVNMKRALVMFVAAMLALPVSPGVAHTAHQAAPVPACVTPDQTCKESMAVGSVGQYTFAYFRSYSLTAPNADITRAVIVMHGLDRNAPDYFDWAVTALHNATDPSLVVIAPHFKGNVIGSATCQDAYEPSELRWSCTGTNSVNRWDDGGQARNIPEQIFSFSTIDMLVDLLSDTTVFPNLTKIYISGHSAGGQFTQRYAGGNQIDPGLLAPVMSRASRAPTVRTTSVLRAPTVRSTPQRPGQVSVSAVTVPIKYVIANPGSYLYVDEQRLQKDATCFPDGACTGTFTPNWDPPSACLNTYNNYKYGLDGRTYGYMDSSLPGLTDAEVRQRFTSRNVDYLMGELDQTSGSMFDVSCEANAQGSQLAGDGSGLVGGRRERGTIFWNYMRRLGATTQTLTIVPGCAHDGRCMYSSMEMIQALSS
jgi:hypothetical protein